MTIELKPSRLSYRIPAIALHTSKKSAIPLDKSSCRVKLNNRSGPSHEIHKGIKPFTPNETTIAAASAIDGGTLVDLEGSCHGIGIFLDGEAGDGENPARGARYNSAIRYLRKHPDSLIAVVSEDKYTPPAN